MSLFKRKHRGPSHEAVKFRRDSERELEEVQRLKTQAKDVGASLRQRRAANHFGLGLEALIREKPV